jgi:hypothetical protein
MATATSRQMPTNVYMVSYMGLSRVATDQ